MNNLCHRGDDELLVLLLDAPTVWQVRDGLLVAPAPTLRHALRKAHDFFIQSDFSGQIIKQPNDEMVIDTHQVRRLWGHLGMGATKPSEVVMAPLAEISSRVA